MGYIDKWNNYVLKKSDIFKRKDKIVGIETIASVYKEDKIKDIESKIYLEQILEKILKERRFTKKSKEIFKKFFWDLTQGIKLEEIKKEYNLNDQTISRWKKIIKEYLKK
ncbi:MAG: hypothetical protein ACPL1F_01455 [bacterium]